MIANDLLVTGVGRFGKVYASDFVGDLIGNAASATNASYAGTLSGQPSLGSASEMDSFLNTNGVQYAMFTSETSGLFGGNDGMLLSLPWVGNTNYGAQLAFDDSTNGTIYVRGKSTNWGSWHKLLHSGNWSSTITNVESANKISKCVRISSSTTTNVGKCIKFATIDISSGAWNSCSGYLIFSPMESDVGCRGILHFFLRTSSTNAEQTGSLRWVSLANNDHAGSVIVVKTADGKFDVYFKPKYQYETTEVTAIFNGDVDSISLANSGTYVDESTLTPLYVSSLHSVSSSCTGNAATADFLNYKWNNEINFAGGNTTGRVLINYRNKETASTSGNANPITSYEFYNTNGSISGVRLRAETFEGNATSVNNVIPEWSGSVAYADTDYLAAWTKDGTKIKALSKGNFATISSVNSLQTQVDNKVSKRTSNGTAYDQLGTYYNSGSTAAYVKISFPSVPSWTMLTMELTIREDYNSGKTGKVIIYANQSTGSDWKNFYAVCHDTLSSNIKVYGSDKQHIYVKGLASWGGLSVDKMLIGDAAISSDLTNMTITGVSELPETYQTATMVQELNTNNYTSYITPASINAATSGHTHNYAGSSSTGGSATSAVKLATARTINGVSFDGTSNITVYSPYENSVNSKNLSTAGWYRVASISALGTDSTLEWNISRNYSNTNSEAYQLLLSMAHQTCNFTQINSQVNTAGITKVRLVLASSSPHSSAAYLEVYYNLSVENTVYSYIRGNDGANKSWTNVAFTAGSIPSGYTSVEFSLSNNPIKASSFEGNLIGNASTATKATQDASGNTITSTYATKTEINNKSKVSIVRW